MADPTPELKHLPSNSLPEGAPPIVVEDSQHLEVFALRNNTAVFVIEERERETRITQPWLSAQDDDLARQVVETTRNLYLQPNKPVLIQLCSLQTALNNALGGTVIAGHMMTKAVHRDDLPPLADDVRARAMTEDEVASFLKDTEEGFARAVMENNANTSSWEDAKVKSREAMQAVAPEGGKTPGHSFLIVEDNKGEKVALLWVALSEKTKQSFCYNIEVEPSKRRMGFGKKTLAIWEHHAAEQGAISIGLNVFGNNLAAQNLYAGAGLFIATTLYRIEK
ncbi:putative N-acetyltransferase YdgE [Cytospora mali]|uniref:N-acetyltransferase YdgE n=1 Tax=Cytospora mali TaxID=578113 RepID=A0A194WBG3_CYTMA|nr:putative N-acetyltransferase YdgE [Valsa mali]